MTTPDHNDRQIATFFDEGPNRVSESTIEAALAHARSHPRRRDPLHVLRGDPMGRGGFGLGRMTGPLPLVAAVGLLLAAAVAGAVVGGVIDVDREPAVVPPVVNPSPLPSPSPTKAGPATIRVDLIEHVGNDAFIEITDESFSMIGALSGDPGDGVDVGPEVVLVENDPADPARVILTWAGGTCDTGHEMLIDADGRTIRMSRQECQGDSLGGVGHVLRLTFDAPAPAAEFDVTLETTP